MVEQYVDRTVTERDQSCAPSVFALTSLPMRPCPGEWGSSSQSEFYGPVSRSHRTGDGGSHIVCTGSSRSRSSSRPSSPQRVSDVLECSYRIPASTVADITEAHGGLPGREGTTKPRLSSAKSPAPTCTRRAKSTALSSTCGTLTPLTVPSMLEGHGWICLGAPTFAEPRYRWAFG
jgi:hypothetical protein